MRVIINWLERKKGNYCNSTTMYFDMDCMWSDRYLVLGTK